MALAIRLDDITHMHCDAIVTATDTALSGTCGVDPGHPPGGRSGAGRRLPCACAVPRCERGLHGRLPPVAEDHPRRRPDVAR